MLIELSVRDLALIEALEVELGPGLNVLTGETGAGKSLLVASLELLLGETPRGGAAQWVRKGADEARVEGRFELPGEDTCSAVLALLRAEAPALADEVAARLEDGPLELILGRTLSRAGRTRAHVDQRPVPLRTLRALAPLVLEIHGQNDHQRLLDPAEQLALLDAHGGLQRDVLRYREARDGWRDLSERLARLDAEAAERRDRLDLLRFQHGELTSAELSEGEHARLREERELLRGAADLRSELGGWAVQLVESDDALVDRLRAAVHAVERWRERLPSLEAPLEDLRSAEIHAGEAAAALASLVDGVTDDPARLEVVEERLAELERLEAKYGRDDVGLLALVGELETSLAELEAEDASHEKLGEEIAAALATLEEAAAGLGQARARVVPALVDGVLRTLASLGLEKARFDVHAAAREGEPEARFGPRGGEDVEFLLAANPGEEPAPLRRVASGGEAARIMLALRTELQPKDVEASARTLVFDEIDSGVGGRLGPEVGEHLRRLARSAQVLCVTHIPAIAASADLHLCTTKTVRGGRTRTSIVPLSGEERVAEVADMIAGGSAHETARAEARRLLVGANGPGA
jgi:DNA repair protein RecN (Recombination protein N)